MAAKSAPNSQIPYNYNNFPISYVKNLIKNDTTFKTNEEYVAAETGRHTRSILSKIEIIKHLNNKINLLPSITQFYLTQYLTRHGFHLEYLNKFKIKNNNICPCTNNLIQNLVHLIKYCHRYSLQISEHIINCNIHNIATPFIIHNLINNISFTASHSRVGRGNLVLRHSVPHCLSNSGGIAC